MFSQTRIVLFVVVMAWMASCAFGQQQVVQWKQGAPGCSVKLVDGDVVRSYSTKEFSISVRSNEFAQSYLRMDLSLLNSNIDQPLHFGPENVRWSEQGRSGSHPVWDGKKMGREVNGQGEQSAREISGGGGLSQLTMNIGKYSAPDTGVEYNGHKYPLTEFIRMTELKPQTVNKGQQAQGSVYLRPPSGSIVLEISATPTTLVEIPLR